MELGVIGTLIGMSCMGSFIQRVSGFGFGIFVMTVFPYLLPSYGEATALSGMLAASMSLVVAIRMRRFIEWHKVLPILATFTVVSLGAVFIVSSIDQKLLKHVLGGILVAVSLYFFIFSERIKLKPTLPAQIGLGTLSGLMGGLFAMQGPPAVLYFMASAQTKEKYIAQIQTYFVIGNLMMTLFRAEAGFVTPAVGMAYTYCLAAVALGAFVGGKVFKKLSAKVLRKIVYGYMAVSGAIALLA